MTITDACSRYLLRCQAVEKTDTERVRAIFEAAFREYGLPEAIRTDNGAPFASSAVGGLSRLAVWWIKLGIVPERIQAGHPEQNGRHERMHRTLKQDCAAAADRRGQQRELDRFRHEYNQVRPHEALDMETPASVYQPSPRPYPAGEPEPEYPDYHAGANGEKPRPFPLEEARCLSHRGAVGRAHRPDARWPTGYSRSIPRARA